MKLRDCTGVGEIRFQFRDCRTLPEKRTGTLCHTHAHAYIGSVGLSCKLRYRIRSISILWFNPACISFSLACDTAALRFHRTSGLRREVRERA